LREAGSTRKTYSNSPHEHRSIIRIINLSDSIDDNIALLDYLAVSAYRHLSAFTQPIKIAEKRENFTKKDPAGISIQLPRLAPDADIETSDNDVATGNPTVDRGDDIFIQLRRRILGQRIVEKNHLEPPPDDDADEEDEEEPREKEPLQKRLNNRMDYFERSVKEWAANAADTAKRRAALVIWFEVKLHMLQRHRERENGLRFIQNWFYHVCSCKGYDDEQGALEQHVFTVAAILSQLADSDIKEALSLRTKVHEALERFCGGEVAFAVADQSLIEHPDVGFASFLLDVDATALHEALHSVLSTVTLRAMLSNALQSYEKGETVNASSSVFESKMGKEFLSMLTRHPKIPFYKPTLDNRSMCSFCYIAFPTIVESDLKRHRIARCQNCGRFTVKLKP